MEPAYLEREPRQAATNINIRRNETCMFGKRAKASSQTGAADQRRRRQSSKAMVTWVFGYGSLLWNAGFPYQQRLLGCIKGYRRVFYQGSTDHRGTPEFPGRTVTLEPQQGQACWGVAYMVSGKEDEDVALSYLEVREKQYDEKVYLDFYKDEDSSEPVLSGVLVYIASNNQKSNKNYLGPASTEEIARQIIKAKGPSGPNIDYVFKLEEALREIGCLDSHVIEIANAIRAFQQ